MTATKNEEPAGYGYNLLLPRHSRSAPGGMVFHVLNRGVGRRNLFDKDGDFLAFKRVLLETLRVRRMRVCAWCLMSNHWHLVLWPEHDGDLAAFMQQLTNTHVKRWKEHRHETGLRRLCQGCYNCSPVQSDEHFDTVVRYVERNALRANMVPAAELWPWSSLGCHNRPDSPREIITDWPLRRPDNWLGWVNEPQNESELAALRHCVHRGTPFGAETWTEATVKRLGLEATTRPRGRPKKTN